MHGVCTLRLFAHVASGQQDLVGVISEQPDYKKFKQSRAFFALYSVPGILARLTVLHSLDCLFLKTILFRFSKVNDSYEDVKECAMLLVEVL